MLKVGCPVGDGFRGYCGGLAAFTAAHMLKTKHFKRKATTYGVLHVGGNYDAVVKQHCPKKFALPLAEAAAEGGCDVAMFTSEMQHRGYYIIMYFF